MKYPERRSLRLQGYDYSQNGWYFITLCTHDRECLFGEIKQTRIITNNMEKLSISQINMNEMVLNELGNVVQNVWESLCERFPVSLDEYQIMPNHFHGILSIQKNIIRAIHESPLQTELSPVGAHHDAPVIYKNQLSVNKRSLLSQIIGYFKMNGTKQIKIIKSNNIFFKVWQRNYYERIIRDEDELYTIRQYIKLNPVNWDKDKNNPNNIVKN